MSAQQGHILVDVFREPGDYGLDDTGVAFVLLLEALQLRALTARWRSGEGAKDQ